MHNSFEIEFQLKLWKILEKNENNVHEQKTSALELKESFRIRLNVSRRNESSHNHENVKSNLTKI